ncbi:hypothetical protein DRM94_03745 [Aeromonas taiwanensis]|jgi:hypothetical protein|uniref:Uncharacterized protein n=1 Tax=Aeromonas taiwanensis TaxID=633417 RepID=A0A5F0KE93_9GAMM|nr:hypothetical protein [Aeromonas taiwanensis]TFF79582.1 hypothetical protein DRM93_03745 [Aeromonas taiwanensis]TFF80583.1 hypothetical protein DRM95_03760 [Aeromonas taiwanensis]TFF82851.1 hypothetical protein DRM94_03745 [Aeromonas taiwanensis]
MKRLGWLVLLASPALWANSLADCQQDAASANCSAYLNGVVDSALMLGDQQAKARFGETFAERALSNRAGERVKQSNKRYCNERMPDAARLKAHLQQQFGANKVDSISDMYDILAVELSCYRSPPGAGTPSDVTP